MKHLCKWWWWWRSNNALNSLLCVTVRTRFDMGRYVKCVSKPWRMWISLEMVDLQNGLEKNEQQISLWMMYVCKKLMKHSTLGCNYNFSSKLEEEITFVMFGNMRKTENPKSHRKASFPRPVAPRRKARQACRAWVDGATSLSRRYC